MVASGNVEVGRMHVGSPPWPEGSSIMRARRAMNGLTMSDALQPSTLATRASRDGAHRSAIPAVASRTDVTLSAEGCRPEQHRTFRFVEAERDGSPSTC